MKSSSKNKPAPPPAPTLAPAAVRRCQPLLGTFVEVTAGGASEPRLGAAVDAAFAAVAAVHQLLSAHDPRSELSEVNRRAHRRPVPVSATTFLVLTRARALAEASDGAFDFTVGGILARWGLRPACLRRSPGGDWQDVELLAGRRVRFRRPVALDLGGIAKGFAVDEAIQALQDHGVRAGVVNAGGDLRAFGEEPIVVYLRHPAAPAQPVRPIRLTNAALATSSPCFTRRRWRGQTISHLVRRDHQRAITRAISVSVQARECWLADALTKVVLNATAEADALLAAHRATAHILAA